MAGWGVYARYIYRVLCFYLPMDYDIVLMPDKNINKGLSISIFHSIPVLSSVAVQFSSVTFYLELQGTVHSGCAMCAGKGVRTSNGTFRTKVITEYILSTAKYLNIGFLGMSAGFSQQCKQHPPCCTV